MKTTIHIISCLFTRLGRLLYEFHTGEKERRKCEGATSQEIIEICKPDTQREPYPNHE